MTDELRALVTARAPLQEIRSTARRGGMTSLFDDGLRKAAAGITTREEVLRVTNEEAAIT